MTTHTDTLCDSCSGAGYDEITTFHGSFAEDGDIDWLMTTLGADVADHLCDATDEPTINCACACRGR